MIRLLCYEPAGQVLQLNADDLTRHVLGLGSTGCGKTTGLVNPLLRQVIGWRNGEKDGKVGLLVLDPKEDDTQDKVQAYAREAGRLEDVVTLSTGGDSFYGYFAGFNRLDQVDEFTRRVLYGTQDMGDQNAYWTEGRFGLVNSALTVLLAGGEPLTFHRVAEFLRAWFYTPDAGAVKTALQFVERLLTTGDLKPATCRRLQLALVEAQNWKALDLRTRELHKSSMNNALRSLLSPAARELFDETRTRRFNPGEVLSGKILVASLNAVCHPQLTAMLFKALKRDYYEAVLSRVTFNQHRDPLCGLILDELPLSVMPEDVDSLALLRSKGGFVAACAQGISSLDDVLGYRRRAALLANFNSVFYFSSREDQTDEHALLTLGFQDPPRDLPTAKDAGSLQVLEGPPAGQRSLICPPGSLARLAQHHAYAKLANGTVTKAPVWLEPQFHDFTPPQVRLEEDDLSKAAGLLRSADDDQAKVNVDVPLFLVHMHRQGHGLKLTPNVVAAAWQLCRPRVHQNRVVARLGGQIRGVESLPPCWLAGLNRWLRKNRLPASTVVGVSVRTGVLWPELDASSKSWGDGPLVVPEAINLFVYPSLWRPLLPRHLKLLRVDRPDLRAELQSLPQVEEENESL
jgi:hypothetical protein